MAKRLADPVGKQRNDLIERKIADAREQSEDNRSDHDHNGGIAQLGLGGPGGLLKLVDHLTEEVASDLKWIFHGKIWQARRDSNPQPTVLETATLPIELHACTGLLDDAAEAPDSRPRQCRVRGLCDGLFDDLGDTTGTNRTTAFADGKLLELFHGDRGD